MECLFIMVVICDSDESDLEDPYDIVCAEYVEQYNIDALEGMELMVFERLKGPDESDVAPVESVMMVREKTDSTHVRQTSSCYPRREFDTLDAEPVADIFNEIQDVPDAAVSPDCRSYCETDGGGASLYYEGDSDCGSVEDRERDTWENWCASAFQNGYGAFPPETDDPLPTVVFSDKLFPNEDIADMWPYVCIG